MPHRRADPYRDGNVTRSWPWQRAFEFSYFPRNSLNTSFFAFAWDGTIFKGRKTFAVPNGQYVAKLSVLKPLGDARNPLDWEWWASDVITVARP